MNEHEDLRIQTINLVLRRSLFRVSSDFLSRALAVGRDPFVIVH